jgi:hypothetical protein
MLQDLHAHAPQPEVILLAEANKQEGWSRTYVGKHQTPLCVWPGQHTEPVLWPVEQPAGRWHC